MALKKLNISIVIPAFNEEQRLPKTIEKVYKFFKNHNNIKSFEILIVNDGSTDNTARIVKQYSKKWRNVKLLNNPENKGKGYSFKHGALKARHDLILLTDADLSTPITEFNKFLKHYKDYDIIIGSRALKPETVKKKQPLHRVLAGIVFRFLTKALFGLPFKDTQCGFKLFKNYKQLFKKQTLDKWTFDVELLVLAKKQGLKVLELPVLWYNSPRTKLKLFKDSLNMFCDLIKIKINDLKGMYD